VARIGRQLGAEVVPDDADRWVRSALRSPTRCAIVQPLRLVRSLTTAPRYLPACSHGSHRTKHSRSRPSSSPRFPAASAAPILAAAAAFGLIGA
jgi:hypothetical protein